MDSFCQRCGKNLTDFLGGIFNPSSIECKKILSFKEIEVSILITNCKKIGTYFAEYPFRISRKALFT